MEKTSQLRHLLITLVFIAMTSSLSGQTDRLEVQFTPMVSLENFSWSIAGNLNGTNPNILSELEWEDIINAGSEINFSYKASKKFRIVATQILAGTLKGQVTDSDYEENDRQSRVFQARENANEGYFLQSGIQLFYDIPLNQNLFLIPQIGLVYSKRHLSLINESNGLNSSYKPYTYGWNLGVGIRKVFENNFELELGSLFGAAKYRASANWNLIEDFQHPGSFKHRANSYSINSRLSISKRLEKSRVALILAYESASTDKGIDTAFFNDGTVAHTRLNNASNRAFRIGIGYSRFLW